MTALSPSGRDSPSFCWQSARLAEHKAADGARPDSPGPAALSSLGNHRGGVQQGGAPHGGRDLHQVPPGNQGEVRQELDHRHQSAGAEESTRSQRTTSISTSRRSQTRRWMRPVKIRTTKRGNPSHQLRIHLLRKLGKTR